ncbi:hypothetical protein HBI31_141990 [Parastagonospora nodorum]|nr:hypothetical protein HBI31_141990 [Parastagonospora nodorum]
MSARIPSRRLGHSASAIFQPRSTRWVPTIVVAATARRNISNPFKSKANDSGEDLSNPLLETYLKRREIEEGAAKGGRDKTPARPQLREGGMNEDPDSLFRPEREIPGWSPALPQETQAKLKAEAEARRAATQADNERKLSELNIDPDPQARRRLERELVIRRVKRHGRLTKADNIARTERQSAFKSQALPTSTKKLQKVVNQIAGKTVSEALVQLRFSKKRIARDVIKGLEIAQNEAIVGRGMGLGDGKRATQRWEKQRGLPSAGDKSTLTTQNTKQAPIRRGVIEMKDGSKKMVTDPSEIYIDQAWVGKGEMWKSPEFRARGMVNTLRHRTTSFTVLLKEEKTRMRISDEIKKKRDKRKLWTALSDRPVIAQRQYCLW